MPDDPYSLSDLARLADVTPRTVRYYVAQGLLPSPEAAGPATRYGEGHLARLRLIRRLQRDHLPLAEIRARLERMGDDEIVAAASALDAAGAGSVAGPRRHARLRPLADAAVRGPADRRRAPGPAPACPAPLAAGRRSTRPGRRAAVASGACLGSRPSGTSAAGPAIAGTVRRRLRRRAPRPPSSPRHGSRTGPPGSASSSPRTSSCTSGAPWTARPTSASTSSSGSRGSCSKTRSARSPPAPTTHANPATARPRHAGDRTTP